MPDSSFSRRQIRFDSIGSCSRIALFVLLLPTVCHQWYPTSISSSSVQAFAPQTLYQNVRNPYYSRLEVETQPAGSSHEGSAAKEDPEEVIACRIVVKGDVQGGYYRSCVLNEAGRFRRLMGTMSPPDDSDTAEIYVEGKRKMVDGFLRWCKKGNVGLSQVVTVAEVEEAEPTGLYDGFYAKTN